MIYDNIILLLVCLLNTKSRLSFCRKAEKSDFHCQPQHVLRLNIFPSRSTSKHSQSIWCECGAGPKAHTLRWLSSAVMTKVCGRQDLFSVMDGWKKTTNHAHCEFGQKTIFTDVFSASASEIIVLAVAEAHKKAMPGYLMAQLSEPPTKDICS